MQHVGLAVTLIEASAFMKLRPPLFLMDWIPDLNCYCGEDVYFCQKLSEAGVKLYVDHDVSQRIRHIGTQAFGPGTVTTNED